MSPHVAIDSCQCELFVVLSANKYFALWPWYDDTMYLSTEFTAGRSGLQQFLGPNRLQGKIAVVQMQVHRTDCSLVLLGEMWWN